MITNIKASRALITITLLLGASQLAAKAQTYPIPWGGNDYLPNLIFPVASIFIHGELIDTDLGDDVDYFIADSAFFSDPVGSGYFPWSSPGGGGALLNVPMTASVPSENMITVTTANYNGSVHAAVGGNSSVSSSAYGTNVPCAAYVVTNNQIYLGVCLYCDRGPSPAGETGGFWWQHYSLNHFQIRVEGAQWSDDSFEPYSDSQGTPAIWAVLANAGVDVLYQPNGDMNDVNPALLATDTVLVYDPAAATLVVNEPSAGPNCVLASLSAYPNNSLDNYPIGVVMQIPVVLPQQPVNMLRIAVQAWDASTPADLAAGLFFETDSYVNDLVGFVYPSASDYNLGATGNGPAPDQQGYGVVFLGPNDSYPGWNGYTVSLLSDYSPPFVIALKPASLVAYNEFPIGILYNVPGDHSSVNYSSASGFNTSWTFSSTEMNQVANVLGNSFTFSLNSAGLLSSFFGTSGSGSGGSGSGGSGSGSGGFGDPVGYTSVSTSQATAANTAQSQEALTLSASMQFGNILGPGSGKSGFWLAPPSGDANVDPWHQAFWADQIVVLPGPIFASWNLPAVSGSAPVLSQQLAGFLCNANAGPVALYFNVANLYCAWRYNTTCWDVANQLQIGPQESFALAMLDPFFAGGMWQGANPQSVYKNRFYPVKELTDLQAGPGQTFSMTIGSGVSFGTQNANVSGAQYSASSGFSFTLSALGLTIGSPMLDNMMTTASTSLQFQNQQADAVTTTMTIMGTISDDGGFHTAVQVWYDTWANTLCFQDTEQSNPLAISSIINPPPWCQADISSGIKVPSPFWALYDFDPNAPHPMLPSLPQYHFHVPPPFQPSLNGSLSVISVPAFRPNSVLTAPGVLPVPPIAVQPPLVPQSPTNFAQPNVSRPPIGP